MPVLNNLYGSIVAHMVRWSQSRMGTYLILATMLLQKTPVIKLLFQPQLNPTTRMVQFWQAVVPVVSGLGAYQALSGATRDVSPANSAFTNPATVGQGEDFVWAAKVELSTNDADVWELRGAPNGLQISVTSKNLATITGKPTQSGTFIIEIIAWEKPNFTGTRSKPYELTLIVEPPAPVITLESYFGPVTPVANGWVDTGWFGLVYGDLFPWILHEDHGWLYCAGEGVTGTGTWMKDMNTPGILDWFWTDPSIHSTDFPYLRSRNFGNLSTADEGWLFYMGPDPQSGGRGLWDYSMNNQGGGYFVAPAF